MRRAGLVALGLTLCAARPTHTYTLWDSQPVASMHPMWVSSTATQRASTLVYPPLVRVSGDGLEHPQLQELSIEAGVADLVLRSGLKWHDGTRVRPAQICETVRVLRDRRDSPLGNRHGPRLAHCELDGERVRIYLTQTQDNDPIGSLGFPLLPTHLSGDLGQPSHPIGRVPIGLGPWKARAIPDGWAFDPQTPSLPALVLRSAPPSATPADLAGQSDGWLLVPAAYVPLVRSLPDWRLYSYRSRSAVMLVLDDSEPPFDRVHHRTALDARLDRRALCARLVGSWPDALLPGCAPMTGPWAWDDPGTNHSVSPANPGALSAKRIRLFVQSDLDLSPETVVDALKTRLHPMDVDIVVGPLADLMGLSKAERRAQFDGALLNRLGLPTDLLDLLQPDGPGNPFATTWPDGLRTEAAPLARRAAHAAFADHASHLFLFELSGLAALPADWSGVWLTDTDGLGSAHTWTFSAAQRDPDPPESAPPETP